MLILVYGLKDLFPLLKLNVKVVTIKTDVVTSGMHKRHGSALGWWNMNRLINQYIQAPLVWTPTLKGTGKRAVRLYVFGAKRTAQVHDKEVSLLWEGP